jgi:aldose 1-epimerase
MNHSPKQNNSKQLKENERSAALCIGGKPAVTLVRPQPSDSRQPQFLSATVLPGAGMNLLQLKAYLPGQGEIDVIASPGIARAKRFLEKDNDAFGNNNFKIGCALLLPYPNRIRGKLSADRKTIATIIADRQVSLPANWSSQNLGAEAHAMHGLILSSQFEDVLDANDSVKSTVSGILHAGNFHGRWFSQTDVRVEMTLTNYSLDITVSARNVGKEPLPMAIAAHPYFALPSGNRQQARLHIPAGMRALVNNYDDVFPTGKLVNVKGTPYDFTAPAGALLKNLYLDDCFTCLKRNAQGAAVIEITDQAAKYGLRILSLSPQINSIQVYAPPDKNFIAIEPQFNLADPFNAKIWGKRDTGMILLQPGQSVSWHIRLELFTPTS